MTIIELPDPGRGGAPASGSVHYWGFSITTPVRPTCENKGGKLIRGSVGQRAVGTLTFVVRTPVFDDSLGSSDSQEPVGVQALSRNRPLNDSANPFCIGRAGSMKRSSTRRCSRHAFNARQTNSGP
jgi:hypothetical protein